MQQYDVSKNKRKITLLVSYAAMTLAVIAISAVCILLVLGYHFDFTNNRVEPGALLQLGSFPSGAQINLDGEQLSFNTPGKRDLTVGPHDIRFQKDGYREWTKHFTVSASEVRWLDYARLVPTTIATSSVKELTSGPADELPAPDNKRIIVLSKADTPVLTLLNLSDPKQLVETTITIPDTALTLPTSSTHSYRLVEWSLGSKYLIVRHDFTSGSEYLRINSNDPKDIVNISSKFGVVLTDLHFSGDTVFYGVENGNLRRFDLGASSISEPIVRDIVSMKLYGSSDMAYVRHANAHYEVGVIFGGMTHLVSTYDDTTPLLVDVSQYYNEHYIAITRGASFELIKNPERSAKDGMAKVITLSYPSDLKWLDIASNGRFVIAGNGTQFMTYDIELATRSDTNYPGVLSDSSIQPQWLDDYTLVSTADNKLRLSDFDGENQQIITDVLPSRAVMLSTDGKLLYSFAKTTSGVLSLQVSKMTTD